MFQILSIALYVCTEPLIRVPKTLHELQAIAKIQTLCRLSFHNVKNFHQVECTPSPTMYTLRRYSDLVHYAFYLLYVFEIWTSKKYTQLPKLFFLCPSRKKIAATALSRRKRAVDRTTTVEPLGSVTRQSKILRIKLVLWREWKKQVMSSKKKEDWRGDYGKREESWW